MDPTITITTTTTTNKHLLHPQPDPTIQNISHRFSKLYINHKNKKKNFTQPTTITTLTVDSNSKTITTTTTSTENKLKKREITVIKEQPEEEKEDIKNEKKKKLVVPSSIPPQVHHHHQVVNNNNNNDKNVSPRRRRRKSFTTSQLGDFFSCAGVKVVAVDMPPFMQIHAVDCARKAHDSLEKFTSKTLAFTLKKEFDGVYGPAWHCIVGTSFGSFVTHSVGGFMYFSMDHKLYILLFKTTVQRAASPELTPS